MIGIWLIFSSISVWKQPYITLDEIKSKGCYTPGPSIDSLPLLDQYPDAFAILGLTCLIPLLFLIFDALIPHYVVYFMLTTLIVVALPLIALEHGSDHTKEKEEVRVVLHDAVKGGLLRHVNSSITDIMATYKLSLEQAVAQLSDKKVGYTEIEVIALDRTHFQACYLFQSDGESLLDTPVEKCVFGEILDTKKEYMGSQGVYFQHESIIDTTEIDYIKHPGPCYFE